MMENVVAVAMIAQRLLLEEPEAVCVDSKETLCLTNIRE